MSLLIVDDDILLAVETGRDDLVEPPLRVTDSWNW